MKEVASAVREILDKDESIGHRKEEDGVIYYSKVSLMLKSLLLLARLMKKGLWKRAIREPLPDTIKYGPYLRDAKYPEVGILKRAIYYCLPTDCSSMIYNIISDELVNLPRNRVVCRACTPHFPHPQKIS